MTERILMNEYKTLAKEPWVNIELNEEDIFQWTIGLIVLNPDSLYYGGYFKASMKFPKNYPYSPPEFRFLRPLWHPNIYADGKLCISILHAPGDDEMSGELASERWSPAQRVESVLISILSLLDDAEVSSPANVDAGVMLRKEPDQYKAIVRSNVEDSKKDIPAGFVMPTHETTSTPVKPVEKDDSDFWAESDVDDDVFGGSDSDEDLDVDDQDSGSDFEDEEERHRT
ncbi:putative ubiquitin conjugating enzyme (UbcC) [Aspergillus candidus]|uniref:Ubiquitin-conjugating enzyme E2 2 n=1 Tax=Aspergillus candidus TaxID=41067 RepID=A0A2I2FBJ6_ASPCN|nr:ubiquitin-conjugating enzyme/RWD-like protein [Aspergillus candidus]PLB37974.1 ubiquitin-conjugating enzyme/RWD-like protein [Aspergillus candidus]